jgi:cobalt transporter subunit CbtA
MYFRNLVLSAFFIAITAGLIFSAYQAIFITPIIISSEVYEVAEPAASHQIEAWAPEDGLERHSWSFATNFLLCFAYALILLSAMTVKTSVNAVKGLFWGGAAYLSIFAAPALGLPPEIPGMEAAYLEGRQAWWLFTVILTALALWLIAFQSPLNKGLGVVLILIPHIIGAPQPEIHGFVNTDPQAIEALTMLWHDFILHTSVANALLWLVIGGLSGCLVKKYIYPIDTQQV